MNRILEINDSDIKLEVKGDAKYRPRTAVRAILRKKDEIALLHVSKHHYYKLPGGGVDEGETIEDGLKREIMEEVGCTFSIVNEIGEILEHRSQIEQVQTSHCYLADVEKEENPNFTQKEIKDGFELVWVTIDEAINLIRNSKSDNYAGKFIVVRDLQFLKEAKKFFK
ncbi:MAG: ADP-ribose pyrophosphatase [Nanoarchaeota archaeon]|nr:ADP-ribose pyrophosphatase [Nanoarchaeota archaeon]|tara:strand:+ start:23193 stop:23696 length:504 start_codon:yes stop_codon:yes gene_type:complete